MDLELTTVYLRCQLSKHPRKQPPQSLSKNSHKTHILRHLLHNSGSRLRCNSCNFSGISMRQKSGSFRPTRNVWTTGLPVRIRIQAGSRTSQYKRSMRRRSNLTSQQGSWLPHPKFQWKCALIATRRTRSDPNAPKLGCITCREIRLWKPSKIYQKCA